MSVPYEIPLSPEPQIFNITLGGTEYQLMLYWNAFAACWMLDIADSTGATKILSGLTLVTGADLLSQYPYLNFGGQLIAQTDGDIYTPPTFDNLGTTGHLYFITLP